MTIASDPTSATIFDLAQRLAFESPRLADLTVDQLDQIAQAVIQTNLRDDLQRLAALARIDGEAEMKNFLTNASRTGSWATIEIYAYGLSILERWTERKGLPLLPLSPRQADDYIYWLRAEGKAPATIRILVAAAGAFFSYLERRFEVVRNPFRGTRAKPAHRPVRDLVVPTSEERDLLLTRAAGDLRAALVFMSAQGFRVGALPTLVITDGRFTGRSKGRDIAGTLSPAVLQSLEVAGLDRHRPFAGYTAERLSDRVLRLSGRLFHQGLVRHPFSAHDLRHFFAVSTYRASPDLYRLKGLLGHSSVATTEKYLRSLPVGAVSAPDPLW